MEFEMNGRKWTIKEVPQRAFWEDDNELDKMNSKEYYFGRTHFNTQEIWLWEGASKEQKRKTLIHELVHCYIGSYFTFASLDGQNEDLWCDIMSNSFDIIADIVKKYFNEK